MRISALSVALSVFLLACANGVPSSSDARVDVDAREVGVDVPTAAPMPRRIVYQLPVRLFSNTNSTRNWAGTLAENGVGKFSGIDARALLSLRELGVTDIYLLGVLRQATLTDYSNVAAGLAADDPDIVKGRAGSYYAIRDYYDVSPDYAEVPANRMIEFEALVARIHAAGLRVWIDFVPNHVARSYASVVFPDRDLGARDERGAFFRPGNNFFYLADPAGQSLSLTRPAHWNPSGVAFDGRFAQESVPRATGNNITSPSPSASDWYETIKLNYGFNFVSQATAFQPVPDTWQKMDDILQYWQSKGVDGFRCDFAHYVPDAAWQYLLRRARERDPNAYFVAEAYERLDGLLADGFDDVYFDAGYDALKRLYQGQSSVADLRTALTPLAGGAAERLLVYLENHDERRLASPIAAGSADDSGFGSVNAFRQLGPLMYLHSRAAVLLYSGQELAETGAGNEGFGGEDGRTSIFDYWSMPSLVPWVAAGFSDAALAPESAAQRRFHRDLFRLSQDGAALGERTVMLESAPDVYAYLRFASGGRRALLVLANLAPTGPVSGTLTLPVALLREAGFAESMRVAVQLVLAEDGARTGAPETYGAASALTLPYTVPAQATYVFRAEAATQ